MINLNLQTTTGVYAGAKNVYVAQVQGTLLGPRLLKFGQAEIQAPKGGQDPAAYNKAVAEAIKRVLSEQNISVKKIISALPGKDVLVRYFQMPRIPKSEWETAVKFEAKKYIPFKIEELMWDFHVVLPQGKDSKMDVTFVAVKRKIAQEYVSTLEESGVKISILEPAPFSLLRIFTLSNQVPKDKPTAIVDVDYGMADINIVKEDISYLTRDVSLPLEEEVLFESLLNEIRMSLDYYEKLFPTESIGKILLSGEVDLRDWDKKLADELKMPIEKVNLTKAMKIQKSLPPLNMTVALGLALRGTAATVADVNLYQFREIKAAAPMTSKEALEFTPEMRTALVRAVTLSGIGLGILYLLMLSPVVREKKKIEEIIKLRPKISLSADNLSYEELETIQKDLKAKLATLNLVVGKDVFATDKLNELPKIIPPGIWLTNLKFSDKVSRSNTAVRFLTIKGVAYHDNPVREIGLVTKFVSNAKSNSVFSKGFTEIKLSSMVSGELKGMPIKDFTVTCTLK